MDNDSSACAEPPAVMIPVIDRSRCEAKGDCVRVCPYSVFALRVLDVAEKSELSLRSRLKLFIHGGKQAFVEKADDCHACGLCVAACPETAITLIRRL